jgi:hypothetical protein
VLFLGTVADLQLSISDNPACDNGMRYRENKEIVYVINVGLCTLFLTVYEGLYVLKK